MKKYVAIATVAILCGAALPAGAVTKTGTVTVQWNTAVAATLGLATNYDATGAQQLTAPAILTNANGGSGACTANGAGSEAAATVNFGAITPDFAQTTGCLYKNGVNALVKTNSTSWNMTEALSSVVTGSTMCAMGNGQTFPFPATGALPATQTARAAAPATTTCPAGSLALTASAATAITSTTAYPGGANIGQDMLLLLGTSSATGAQTVTLTYTVIAS